MLLSINVKIVSIVIVILMIVEAPKVWIEWKLSRKTRSWQNYYRPLVSRVFFTDIQFEKNCYSVYV